MEVRSALSVLSLVAGVTFVAVYSAPAAAASTQGPISANSSCYIVIDRQGQVSKSNCVGGPVQKGFVTSGLSPSDGPPLITMYENINFGGKSTTVYGQFGTCDAAGYGWKQVSVVPGWFPFAVSSYRLYGECDTAVYYRGYAFDGLSSGEIPNQNMPRLPGDWNDKIHSIRIRSKF